MNPLVTNHIICGLIFVLAYKFIEADIVIMDGTDKLDQFHDVELLPSEYDSLKGVILSADPPDACTPIAEPPNLKTSMNWFVLISGNFCDFETKIIYAQLAGYSAAIIYNLKGNDIEHHNSYSPDYYSNITAVLVRRSTGVIIKESYLYTIDKRLSVIIYPNDTFDTISFLSMMVAALAGLIVIIMVSFMLIKYLQRSHEIQNSRLSSRHLEQLPTSRFQTGDAYETCAICLEDFKNNDLLRILPCCHGYHANCIDQWLTESRRICPICKKQVIFNGESPDTHNHPDLNRRSETTPLLRSSDSNSPPGNNYRALSVNIRQSHLHITPFNIRETPPGNATCVNIGEPAERSGTRNIVEDIISNHTELHSNSRNEVLSSDS